MSSDSLIHSIAGATGGAVAMAATYPLVFLSTRSAVERSKERKSLPRRILDIIDQEGLSGLYSGLKSGILGIAITNGVYYLFYERSREIIVKSRKGGKGLSTIESMVIGLIAGCATAIISNPIWVIQTSQTVRTMEISADPSRHSGTAVERPAVKRLGILETIEHILQKDGVRAFWRGIGPALVLVMNPVLQYTVFEQLKNLLIVRRAEKLKAAGLNNATAILTDRDFFVLGALSKLVATSVTYPYIVVKSRLQAGSGNAKQYKSALHGLLTITKEEGVEGLYSGIGSKLVQSVLTAAILFASQKKMYDMTKKALA